MNLIFCFQLAKAKLQLIIFQELEFNRVNLNKRKVNLLQSVLTDCKQLRVDRL